MTGTQVQQQDAWLVAYNQLAPEVRERWELEQIKTIRNTVAQDLSPSEFQMGLAIAAKYDLDPLLKEIWFAKSEGRDGRPGRLLLMVGRDGLLRNARRDPDFRGFDTDVVHEKDDFRVKRLPDGNREIHHEYVGATAARGPIVGAWAQVYLIGRPSLYFFAPMEEYAPRNANSRSPWMTQPSVMIQKCALSLCLRLAFNLSGVVGEDEGARAVVDGDFRPPTPPSADAIKEAKEKLAEAVPEDLRERFSAAWAAARETLPGRYTTAAAAMSLSGQDRDVVVAYIERIETEVAAARAEAEEVHDAEVVEDLRGGGDRPADEEPPGSGGELPADEGARAQVEEESPVVASQEVPEPEDADAVEDVEDLRRQLSELYDRMAAAEADPDHDPMEVERLDAEVADVEERLRIAGADVPGQEAMEL